jgi:hypothetical protein
MALMQPLTGLQESSVQGLVSLQFRAGPGTQVPPEQASPLVQAVPSLQALVLFVYWHPRTESQESLVQSFASLQLTGS